MLQEPAEQPNDPVVSELEVFINQALCDELQLLQYPLRAPWRKLDGPGSEIERVRYRTRSGRLQFEHKRALPIEAEEPAAAPAAITTGGRCPLRANYAVGLLRHHQLHLCPLRAIVQLRPSFAHLQQQQSGVQGDAGGGGIDSMEETTAAPEEAPRPQAVVVQFQRRESERAVAARTRSATHQQRLEEGEAWLELRLQRAGSAESRALLERLVWGGAGATAERLQVAAYLDALAPIAPVPPAATPTPSSREDQRLVSLEQLARVELVEQVALALRAAGLLSVARARDVCPGARLASDEVLLAALERSGLLVRGVWAARPELAGYAGSLAHLYEYALLLFEERPAGGLRKRDVLEPLGSAPARRECAAALDEMLARIARRDEDGLWHLRLVDEEAGARLPTELLARQERRWQERRPVLLDALRLAVATIAAPSASSAAGFASVSAARVALGEGGEAAAGLASGPYPGATQSEQLGFFLAELLGQYGVCSLAFLRQNLELLRRREDHPYALLREAVPDAAQLQAVLKRIAAPLHGAWYLKSTGQPQLDRYRDVVLRAFADRIALKKSDLQGYAQRLLGEPIPPHLYQRLLREFAYPKGNQWIFKSGNGTDS